MREGEEGGGKGGTEGEEEGGRQIILLATTAVSFHLQMTVISSCATHRLPTASMATHSYTPESV